MSETLVEISNLGALTLHDSGQSAALDPKGNKVEIRIKSTIKNEMRVFTVIRIGSHIRKN